MSNNTLSGPLPWSIGRMLSLRQLNVTENFLNSTIPASLGSATSLKFVHMGNNLFSGPLPSSLGSLYNVSEVALYNNRLTGTIPSELGALASLSKLSLVGNNITGTVPLSFAQLSSLVSLELDGTLDAYDCANYTASNSYYPNYSLMFEDPNAYVVCTLLACAGNDEVVASGCAGEAGSCTGDQYVKLYSDAGVSLSSSDDYCGLCSRVSAFGTRNECEVLRIRQGCSQGTCTGRLHVMGTQVYVLGASAELTPVPTAAPTGMEY